ncbi:nuclear transport factor 2 family protein [Gordonia neofelifaecis]|uniref:SnoaL-like domain-containing protein n=1 Tax=Gordonia neofelifaecis NRRL B-59395 TaxID=644548 RepID=F1YGX0_9ACTN|nr:nuclear transport factor 2 family protein [Gordonia neofelifaecis]EGD56268.1 hypothetical protein SCNU_05441 [Gordonia neofelifaecis NRRL B-59395]
MHNDHPEEAIRSLIARIAHTADDGEIADYAALFTTDAVWDMPADPRTGVPRQLRRGHDEILGSAQERRDAGITGPGSATRHLTTCSDISVSNDGTATAVTIWQFYADTTTVPRLVSIGRYDDVFVFDEKWRLAKRSITLG